jgi:REP element-mobilizing transposase RayT
MSHFSYNPNIHHRRSIRLKEYDYAQEGLYFLTLCTKNRVCLFGHIENGAMILNEAGVHAQKCWLEIPEHFPQVVLHPFIVMPNHVHGVIEITNTVGANYHSPHTTNEHSPDDKANYHSPHTTNEYSPHDKANYHSPHTTNEYSSDDKASHHSPHITNEHSPQDKANYHSPHPENISTHDETNNVLGIDEPNNDSSIDEMKNHSFIHETNNNSSIDESKNISSIDETENISHIDETNGGDDGANNDSHGNGANNDSPLPPRSPSQTVGSIERGFKIGVTKWFRTNGPDVGAKNFSPLPIWQRNYYDHIIRNETAYNRIVQYIINNPSNWKEDKFYKE